MSFAAVVIAVVVIVVVVVNTIILVVDYDEFKCNRPNHANANSHEFLINELLNCDNASHLTQNQKMQTENVNSKKCYLEYLICKQLLTDMKIQTKMKANSFTFTFKSIAE